MAKRRNSNRRRRRGSFRFLYKLLSMLIICAAIVVAITLFFKVEAITVSGQDRYTAQQVQEPAQVQYATIQDLNALRDELLNRKETPNAES